MDNTPDVIARLNARLDTLERRVFTLEHPSLVSPPVPVPAVDSIKVHSHQDADTLSFAQASGIFPMLGKALLGIAGAYLLRAVAESGALPKLAVVVLAITYAGMWLVFAVRVRTMAWYTGITYATTSSLILAPMLWELTLHFKVLPSSMSAAVLAAFATAALALTWKRNLVSVFWVTYSTTIFMALVLMIATQDLAPFLWAILLIVLVSEFAACRGHQLNARILVAVVADIAVSSVIYIFAMPENARAGYSSISIPVLIALVSIPFFIYIASVTIQTTLRGQRITVFEIVQTVLAFLLASYGSMTFSSGDHRAAIGVVFLVLSAAGYAVAFAWFSGQPVARNFRVYTAWSAALLLLGSFFCLSQMWLSIWFGIVAIIATLIGARRTRSSLEFQGSLFLVGSAFFSGLLGFEYRSLIGSLPSTPTWILGVIFAVALFCYGFGGRSLKEHWRQWLPNLVSAALAVSTGAAFVVFILARAMVHLHAPSISPDMGPLELIQTLTTCLVALGLADGGSRWHRSELTWLAYTTLVLVAAKILFEDVRHGHLIFIAASFFLYAATLILLPRLAGHGRKEQTPAEINS
jgi:hypothetical protein